MKNCVAVVVATYRRAPELARLLDSLKTCGAEIDGVIVTDNGNDPATKKVFEQSGFPGCCLPQAENAGCGAGLKIAEKAALDHFRNGLTHVWILDDDAVVLPGALDVLLGAMQTENADAACPMVLNEKGGIGNYPGLLDAEKFRAIREMTDPAEFVARCGSEPVTFSWAPGIALLVSRRAIDELGFHRDDFWVRGEDLEFSLRITHRFKGIMVPAANVRHVPPPATGGASGRGEYLKHCAMLQNLCYTGLRLAHGRRIARTLPGNFRRFFKTWPWGPALEDAARAAWFGAAAGSPAGIEGRDWFKRAFEEMQS